jgi:CelD/BcsL family acetyltransferase involved in cellulose biosynthesis
MARYTTVQAATIDALPPSARALLDRPEQALFSSRAWYDSFVAAGLADGARPVFLALLGEDGLARAILPCQSLPSAVTSLTSYYSCDFRPILAIPGDADAAFALGRAAAAAFARDPLIRFDSLDAEEPALAAFLAGLRRPGRALLRYAHFGHWWEQVGPGGFAAYLAGREGALRETIKRKGRGLERAGATLGIVPAAEIERGIGDYQAVYVASWKEPEPFPDFQPTLMRKLAATGALRLAICHVQGRPIAAQMWVVADHVGTVLKLAHDATCDRQSPGTVLTAYAIRRLIEDDGITRLDFGRGDDPYKRAWTTRRTQHIGVVSASLWQRPVVVARHWAGAARRIFVR